LHHKTRPPQPRALPPTATPKFLTWSGAKTHRQVCAGWGAVCARV
jgi:hypothetical protein